MKGRWSELKRFSTALAELYAPGGTEDFPSRVLAAMERLLPGGLNIYHEFTPTGVVTHERPGTFTAELSTAFLAHLHEHPTLPHIFQTGTQEPLMFSDFLSLRELRDTGIYREGFEKIGVDRQIGGVFPGRGMKIGYAFNREGRNFREEDRLMVSLLTQHLAAARRNAEIWSLVTPRGAGRHWIELDGEARVRACSARADAVLREWFGDVAEVPEAVVRWVQVQRRSLGATEDAATPAEPLQVRSAHGTLTLHYLPAGPGTVEYLLLEERRSSSPLQLVRLGLTRREAEVLYWVAEGKRNPEIATILGTSPRTVSKQLEHIFAKLGVETRGAASVIAREALSSPAE